MDVRILMMVSVAVLAAASPALAKPFHCRGRQVGLNITMFSGRSDERVTISCEHDQPRLVAASFNRGKGGVRTRIKITPEQLEHVWQLAEAAHWRTPPNRNKCGDGEGVTINQFDIREGKTRRQFECAGTMPPALEDLASAISELDPGE
jgi:hypothetical protein